MTPQTDELIPTRATLLLRLKDCQDQASWQDFFKTYENLIRSVAIKSGLNEAEAKDVVQETMLAVFKNIGEFKYDPAVCSFKVWLLKMTRWRIVDQLRKRGPTYLRENLPDVGELPHTQTTGELIDPSSQKLEMLWDDEWEKNLLAAAVANVKRRVEPERYQIFDFYVNRNWPPEKVAVTFGVSLSQVYVCKHRITEAIKQEIERLRAGLI